MRITNSETVLLSLRGIAPKSLLKEWTSAFKTPQSVAQTVLHKFIGHLEAQASALIWKPCSATIAWEESQGIKENWSDIDSDHYVSDDSDSGLTEDDDEDPIIPHR